MPKPTTSASKPKDVIKARPAAQNTTEAADQAKASPKPSTDAAAPAREDTAAQDQGALISTLGQAQLDHMVNRFLGWHLPETFRPDGGISFEPTYNNGTPEGGKSEPVGTNLLTATEAAAMVLHMIEGLPGVTTAKPNSSGPLFTVVADDLDELRSMVAGEVDRLLGQAETHVLGGNGAEGLRLLDGIKGTAEAVAGLFMDVGAKAAAKRAEHGGALAAEPRVSAVCLQLIRFGGREYGIGDAVELPKSVFDRLTAGGEVEAASTPTAAN